VPLFFQCHNHAHCDADGVHVAGKPGLANSTDNEEKEGGGSQKPGAKKGKRAPYLESMQRNLQKFMPLTSEGVYLLVNPSFSFLSLSMYASDSIKQTASRQAPI
jgi:hypothetical protein